MSLSGVDYLLWIAGFVGHLILLGVLFLRKRARQFPVFTALITNSIVRTIALFLVSRHGSAFSYFCWYVTLGVVDSVLELAVVYEIAAQVFRPLGRWAPDVQKALWVLAFGSFGIASMLTWIAGPADNKWQFAAIAKANFFSSTLLGELFLGMVVLSVTVGLPWKTHVARITQGFGTYAILDILLEAGHALYGRADQIHANEVLDTLRISLYLACLTYWIVMLWKNAPEGRALPEKTREQLRSLQARLAYDLYTIRNWRRP